MKIIVKFQKWYNGEFKTFISNKRAYESHNFKNTSTYPDKNCLICECGMVVGIDENYNHFGQKCNKYFMWYGDLNPSNYQKDRSDFCEYFNYTPEDHLVKDIVE